MLKVINFNDFSHFLYKIISFNNFLHFLGKIYCIFVFIRAHIFIINYFNIKSYYFNVYIIEPNCPEISFYEFKKLLFWLKNVNLLFIKVIIFKSSHFIVKFIIYKSYYFLKVIILMLIIFYEFKKLLFWLKNVNLLFIKVIIF